jgi:hypothetical protein
MVFYIFLPIILSFFTQNYKMNYNYIRKGGDDMATKKTKVEPADNKTIEQQGKQNDLSIEQELFNQMIELSLKLDDKEDTEMKSILLRIPTDMYIWIEEYVAFLNHIMKFHKKRKMSMNKFFTVAPFIAMQVKLGKNFYRNYSIDDVKSWIGQSIAQHVEHKPKKGKNKKDNE